MTKARQIKTKGEANLFGHILLLERQERKKKGRKGLKDANLQVEVYSKGAAEDHMHFRDRKTGRKGN